jgi:hypothetical protein
MIDLNSDSFRRLLGLAVLIIDSGYLSMSKEWRIAAARLCKASTQTFIELDRYLKGKEKRTAEIDRSSGRKYTAGHTTGYKIDGPSSSQN